MADAVIVPLVSLAVKQYLDPLVDAGIASELPRPRPSRFVHLRSAGGYDRNMVIGERLLTVECWETSDLKAGQLAEKVHGLLRAAPRSGQSVIRKVTTVGAPSQSPDPDDRSPRYRFTVQIALRGEVS